MPIVPPPVVPYQLPNIPSNTYSLLSNFAIAVDTANTKLTGHANKVSDIHTSANNAVGHVVSTSKGKATDALDTLWANGQTDLSHAHDQLSAITTSSQGIGPGPNDFRSTLEQYSAVIQTGLAALDTLRQHQDGNGVVMLFGSQMMQLKQEVDQLDSALANINMALDIMAMAIRGLNNGFRAACATGLVPGQALPLFSKNAFAHQMSSDDGGKGNGGTDGGGTGGDNPIDLPSTATEEDVQKMLQDTNPKFPLTRNNAVRALDGPEGTHVEIAGQGGEGADITFVDKHGNVVLHREVKCIQGTGQGTFNREISKAASQAQYNGQIFVQMPEGTDAARYIARFRGARSTADLAKYNTVSITIADPAGNILWSGPIGQ